MGPALTPLITQTADIVILNSTHDTPHHLIAQIMLKVVGNLVFHLPSYLVSHFVALLGRQFSFTLTFSSLLLLFIGLVAVIWAFVRYRYLTKYSRLPPEPERQEPKMDFFMDTQTETPKSGISSYLDDFLSAIKVFGYLERSVFHELTKQMKTYKMEAGETMELKNEKGFAIVVDGCVQVFGRAHNTEESRLASSDSHVINGQGYQLLNEVKRGAPMTSLFTILSLFTEDVQLNENLRHRFDNVPASVPLDHNGQAFYDNTSEYPFDQKASEAEDHCPDQTEAERLSDEIVARASEHSTIAIIPDSAFRNLTRKFPKATSHIVQVILTRCQRVTFQTGHYYLGLTPEMFQPEIALNLKAKYDLPSYLYTAVISRLNELVKRSDRDESVIRLDTLKPPKKNRQKNSSELVGLSKSVPSRQVVIEPHSSHPGDLLSNVPLSRSEDDHVWSPPPLSPRMLRTTSFTGDDETEDGTLRTALAECIFKFLGLDGSLLQTPSIKSRVASGVPSLDASPKLSAASVASETRSLNGLSSAKKSSIGYFLNNLGTFDDDRSTTPDDELASNVTTPKYEDALGEAANNIEVVYFKKGTVLSRQNEKSNGLYYVVDGILEVGYSDRLGNYRELYTVKPGGLGGFIGAVLGYRSFADIKAKTDVYVGFLPRTTLENIADKFPMVYLNLAKTLTSVLSRLILNLDFALEWVQVQAGQVLFHEGDDSDAIYIVLNGRLRSVTEKGGQVKVVSEHGQGESIGELEVLTLSKRPTTLHAIRDSELARFPRSLFESLALQHPSITFEISRLVASRVRMMTDGESEINPSQSNFRTVAIVPITYGLPVSEFGNKLMSAYEDNNHSAVQLNNSSVLSYLGRNAFNKMGRLKLSGYLADLEERYQTVLYVADTNVNALWTQACIAQADCILLLADAMAQPDMGEYERLLVKMKTTARTELILIHPDRYVPAGSTSLWLKNRIWVHSHHHVQMQLKGHTSDDDIPMMVRGKKFEKLRYKVQLLQSEIMTKYRSRRTPVYRSNYLHKNDFNRLARILSGQAVGLVLGGGGARGISHIGIIRALEENGIPIDFIGGTSIGSFVGGLYAKEYDLVPIYGRAKKFAGRLSSLWRMAFDLTYPATSYTTGHEFNRGIWKSFGDSRIEDFWIKYYNNTTNITHSRMEVHHSGYAWRYIRASMSLAGLLPPVTDKGSMLLDGGYVDNLPVDEMRRLGAKVVFAVDVGSIDDTTPMSYGDTLSGIWVLFNRWNIFSQHPNVPSLAEIQARLAYVSSVGALERAKATPGVIYLRPPIDNYATLDFGKFDEIYRVGTQYGHAAIEKLKREDKLPHIPGAETNRVQNRRPAVRRNSI
ncbi:lysophospholipase Nte1p [Trichomonascus vanleenenianus]|uniref:lysophospholipase n=1 Tax=Trichomonascus vanleenenianus TaxID=2268995 RepID=UPI003ECA5B13